MKKIKVSFILILLIVLISSITYSNAKIGDKIDDVLYTDIITEINGQEVESFNINGSTAIYVTEAKKLGYKVNWDGDNRLVTIINDEAMNPSYVEKKLTRNENNSHQIGDKINNVLYTDIQTKINGNEVESFNINGSTAIFVTAFKEVPGVTVTWNADQRRVVVSSESIANIDEEIINENEETIEEEIVSEDGGIREIDGLELVDRNNTLYAPDEEEPFTGNAIWYYENGHVKTKAKYIDGVLQGEVISYYESGEVRAKENYIDGLRQGEGISYYESGQIEVQANFIDGKLDGEVIAYYENGEVKVKMNIKAGVRHGEAIHYNENGEVEEIETYKDGELVD